MTDAQAREIAAAETAAAGEELLWWGRPAAGRMALRSVPISLFGIPFAAFALFWMAAAAGFRWPDLARGGFSLFPLFGAPFLVVGAALVLAPAFAWRAGRRTIYAATRSGVWIVGVGRTRKVQRHAIEDARELRTSVRPDGSGDLVVGRRAVPGRGGQLRFQEVTLVGVSDVRRVERIVASLARPAQPTAAEPEWERAAASAARMHPETGRRTSTAKVAVVTLAFVTALVAAAGARVLRDRARPVPTRATAMAERAPMPEAALSPPAAATNATPPAPEPTAHPRTPSAAKPPASAALPPPPVTFASYGELCDRGDGAACTRAATELASGSSGAPDAPAAARLYARGCELAEGAACRRLGWMLQRGAGIAADRRAAAGWHVRACELGDMEGCRSGGFALAYGDGVPADPRRATPMLERACAASGFPRACAALGDVLEKASPPDVTRALEAYGRGCTQRDGDCCDRAARLARR